MKYKFKDTFEDIKQCQICGFSEAKGERSLHSAFHHRHLQAQVTYGKEVMDYNYLIETETTLNKLLVLLREESHSINTNDMTDTILDMLYSTKYTRSMRVWDYHKKHPSYEEYITLLWNSVNFLTYVELYLPITVVEKNKQKYRATRQLKQSGIFNNDFIFVGVEATGYRIEDGVINLESLEDIEILFEEEEQEEEIVSNEVDTEEYGEVFDLFNTLLKGKVS